MRGLKKEGGIISHKREGGGRFCCVFIFSREDHGQKKEGGNHIENRGYVEHVGTLAIFSFFFFQSENSEKREKNGSLLLFLYVNLLGEGGQPPLSAMRSFNVSYDSPLFSQLRVASFQSIKKKEKMATPPMW